MDNKDPVFFTLKIIYNVSNYVIYLAAFSLVCLELVSIYKAIFCNGNIVTPILLGFVTYILIRSSIETIIATKVKVKK